MSETQDDPRFPAWEPDEKTLKTTILYHMSYAHEKEAKKEGIEWWGSNVQYWLGKYTRKQLLEIHQKYHDGSQLVQGHYRKKKGGKRKCVWVPTYRRAVPKYVFPDGDEKDE